MFRVLSRGVNVQPILDALNVQPELWNQDTYRTCHQKSPHKEASDILIRFNDVADIKHVLDDIECYWQDAAFKLPVMPYIYDLMMNVAGERIGRCVITRLKPGAKIAAHADQGAPAAYYQRFHLCLQNAPGAKFICGDEVLEPQAGDWFILDNSMEHSVINDSTEDRLTMIVDIRTPLFEDLKPSYMKYVPEPLAETYPEGISYQEESFTLLIPELKFFEPLHWAELGVTKDDVPVDMGWHRYVQLEKEGKVHVATVRDSGRLIGYHITFVGPHYHYHSTLHGMVDLYYILPEYRKNKVGVGLFKFAEAALKKLGVVRIITGTKVHLPNDKLFASLGYTMTDTTWVKVI